LNAGNEPQVSWKAIEQHAVIALADGTEAGKVKEVAGDPEADIFSGLVASLGLTGADRFVPAEHVTAIWPDRVEVDLTREALDRLPDYEQPVEKQWQPEKPGFFQRLFGRR